MSRPTIKRRWVRAIVVALLVGSSLSLSGCLTLGMLVNTTEGGALPSGALGKLALTVPMLIADAGVLAGIGAVGGVLVLLGGFPAVFAFGMVGGYVVAGVELAQGGPGAKEREARRARAVVREPVPSPRPARELRRERRRRQLSRLAPATRAMVLGVDRVLEPSTWRFDRGHELTWTEQVRQRVNAEWRRRERERARRRRINGRS